MVCLRLEANESQYMFSLGFLVEAPSQAVIPITEHLATLKEIIILVGSI